MISDRLPSRSKIVLKYGRPVFSKKIDNFVSSQTTGGLGITKTLLFESGWPFVWLKIVPQTTTR